MLLVNDRDRVEWRPGMTVRDLLEALGYDYALMTVTVDGQFVPEEEYAVSLLRDGAEVIVFHLAHGG